MSINIVIADEHTIIRRGIVSMIHHMPSGEYSMDKISFNVVGDTDSVSEIVTMLSQHRVDILFLGFSLKMKKSQNPISELDGVSLVKWLARKFPDTRIVVLSQYRNRNIIHQVLLDGAVGYISRGTCEKTLWRTIVAVSHGETYIERGLMDSLFRGNSLNDQELTLRENDVLRMLCRGLSLTDISRKMNLSNKTISAHKLKAMDKLGVKSDCQLYCLLSQTRMFDITI
ncbi:response regulator transcription factor [Pectobacterium parmentieri]|uniref:Capsular synthesis regulator component B n=1 Tax=Pectobacterium parmentieri TaxID=1905730 RepID=A0A0H3I2P0_PECPM|nr:response regulator transcription factor [Pectobacterium parmentieri]AFI89659.1 Capsular synthesis regulator component B [Pectobacterium parmentieri]MBI0472083.1 response regulator transcription factor [Pectobacterium parmentieri]MBI0495192.1 response regulator transcription factor [Pectobacterium parmentieri]MBI0556244.1 response regulator transcription factor [Pectobacterium parmentieri]MBI0569328.1 response regulator transcription factor [Pectobacterium parmentieri]